jgi:hypothetical protein
MVGLSRVGCVVCSRRNRLQTHRLRQYARRPASRRNQTPRPIVSELSLAALYTTTLMRNRELCATNRRVVRRTCFF